VNCSDHSPPEVEFYPLLANGLNYPKSVIPAFASLFDGGWQVGEKVTAESAFLEANESFVQGRYALAEAMRRADAGQGKVVLLPAFHCRVMVEAVLYLGAQPCFYPVKADLQPDFGALSALLKDEKRPVVAMLFTHYFGFPNALEAAERFCVQHAIALIEDCAHALYGKANGRLLGTVGRYAIASPWKFLPVRDGGLLRDNSGGAASRQIAQPWRVELKAWVAMLQIGAQRASRCRTLPVIEPDALQAHARQIATRDSMQVPERGLQEFIPARSTLSSLRASRWVTAHTAHGRVARRRRENYLRWLDGVRYLTGVQPLFPTLPDGVVPYAFPLLVDAEGIGFHLLKLAGIPIWRWEDMAVTDCAVSRDYRVRLLQLPCHQGISEEEMAWMISVVRAIAPLVSDSRAWESGHPL